MEEVLQRVERICIVNIHRVKAASLVSLREPAMKTPERKVKVELCICYVCKLLRVAYACLECRTPCNICSYANKRVPGKT